MDALGVRPALGLQPLKTLSTDPIRRLADWRPRLRNHLIAVEKLPFRYGSSDCFCLINGAALAMTGRHCFPGIEDNYSNRFGMLRLILRNGHRSLLEMAAAMMRANGWPGIDEADARPGDFAVMPGIPLTSLGVCWENGVLVRMIEGLFLVPSGHALATWRVPNGL